MEKRGAEKQIKKQVQRQPQKAEKAVGNTTTLKSSSKPLAHGVGRRKSAIARVWLKRGKGNIAINEKNYKNYFDTEITRLNAAMPFMVYPQAANYYDVEVNVLGGGLSCQADAVKLGISRALAEVNEEIRPLLKEHGLLTVDSRVKERKKYGQKAARRKFQFVKR